MWKDLVKSKKFIMAIAGVLAVVIVHLAKAVFQLELETDQVTLGIAGIIASYLVGQGLADEGKEAEKMKDK